MWVRGLKPAALMGIPKSMYVAPHVGAWIETGDRLNTYQNIIVAPHVGAWIETG